MEKMQTLKIGIVVFGSPDQESGGYLYDRELFKHLEKGPHSLSWVSIDREKPDIPFLTHTLSNLDVGIIDELCHSFFSQHLELLRLPKITIALVHHLKYQEDWSLEEKSRIREEEKSFLDGCNALLVNSRHTKQQVEDLIQKPLPTFLAYPAGSRYSHSPSFRSHPNQTQEKTNLQGCLLSIGNIIPRKGFHTLLETLSLKEFQDKNFQLRIIGSYDPKDEYFSRLQKMIRTLSLENRIQFLGKISDEQVLEQWAWAECFVLPSSLEGFGIVFLEALSMGIPVVASNKGGSVEIFRNGEGGYFWDGESPQSLGGVLGQVFISPEHWRSLSHLARERSQHFLPWDQTFQGVEDFILSQ